jgi:hypothetical protein
MVDEQNWTDDPMLDFSMEAAYAFMEDLGWDDWVLHTSVPSVQKERILRRMEVWFCVREEYERCAKIKRAYDQIQKLKK